MDYGERWSAVIRESPRRSIVDATDPQRVGLCVLRRCNMKARISKGLLPALWVLGLLLLTLVMVGVLLLGSVRASAVEGDVL